jgi:V8-like Glu-specific endopeptidase
MPQQHFAACVVRFRNRAGGACGSGFLIDRRHVMTCAHVVNVAVGRVLQSKPQPDGALQLDIPFAAAQGIEAEVIEWHAPVPYAELKPDKPSDVAVLRLKSEPSGVTVARTEARRKWGEQFRTFGFPVEHGQPADGETMAEDAGGWVHLRHTKDYGHLIKPGFSGAPVFTGQGTVLGMMVAIQEDRDTRVAYGETLRRLEMAWPSMARPYKGLACFDPADADDFHGREAIITELFRRIERAPLTLIIGASGGGKSSLVFGGLMPKLDDGIWHKATFRPGREPLNSVAWALAELMVSRADPGSLMDRAAQTKRQLKESPDTLFETARALRRAGPGTRVLLVADQFEELFTLCRDEADRTDFLEMVSLIARSQSPAPVTLVATLRADFVGEILRIPLLSQLLEGRYLMLRAMEGAELGHPNAGQ